jgi:hypothetical protein
MNWILVAAILIVAAILSWLALEIRGLRLHGERALRDARGATDLHSTSTRDILEVVSQHASSAVAAADAARESALTARLVAESGQRAWLSIDGVNIMSRNGRNFPVAVSTVLRNGGRTPALDVQSAQICIVDRGSVDSSGLLRKAPCSPEGNLGPGSSTKLSSTFEYPAGAEAAGRIRDGESMVLICGIVRYRDILGGLHETFWAFQYDMDLCQFRPSQQHCNQMN